MNEADAEKIASVIIPTLWCEFRNTWYKSDPLKHQEKRYLTDRKKNDRVRTIAKQSGVSKEIITKALPENVRLIINPEEVVVYFWKRNLKYELYPNWKYPIKPKRNWNFM